MKKLLNFEVNYGLVLGVSFTFKEQQIHSEAKSKNGTGIHFNFLQMTLLCSGVVTKFSRRGDEIFQGRQEC